MVLQMRRLFFILWTLWSVDVATADDPTLRFDMGAADGPLSKGFIRIQSHMSYSPEQGYGWESDRQNDFLTPHPGEDYAWIGPGGQVIPRHYIIFKEYNAVTADGVSSKEDLIFRADVPNGVYRVKLTLGNLEKALGSIQIHINGQLAADDFDIKHFGRRGAADHQYGFVRAFRHVVRVENETIRIRLHGDQTRFLERLDEQDEKPIPGLYLFDNKPSPLLVEGVEKRGQNDIRRWGDDKRSKTKIGGNLTIWEDIGAPFAGNAINAIEIYPFVKPPLRWENGELISTTEDKAAKQAVDLFNARDFARAEEAFEKVADPYVRALGFLWLAGRPQYEEELRLVPKALAILEELAPSRTSDLMFVEIHELARRMDKAIWRFVHRSDEQRAYNELLMIAGEIASMQPEDPTYYKALIYAARGYYMVIPQRMTMASGTGRQLMEILADAGFEDNRFVRWYLKEEWRDLHPDWRAKDYSEKTRGAPEWAAAVYEAYNRELDLAEWWFANRQMADGSMGGGWGDDVEILRGFGAFGAICPDASDAILEGVRKVVNGAWNSGSIDPQGGYFYHSADTEHSGEWTGDTLPAVIRIDYGNPVWIERSMKTAKLMRDLWMDENPKGHFMMRSNFLGALGVGPEFTRSDSRINGRPV